MSNMKRLEKDSLGSISVPEDALWGAQTQRSILNFDIGDEVVPLEIIHAIAQIKASAARVNNNLGLIDTKIAQFITEASSEIIEGKFFSINEKGELQILINENVLNISYGEVI